jgi:hypothetical protein
MEFSPHISIAGKTKNCLKSIKFGNCSAAGAFSLNRGLRPPD